MKSNVKLGWRNLRDFGTWALGVWVAVHQVLNPPITLEGVGLVLTLMGLPFVFRSEDKPR